MTFICQTLKYFFFFFRAGFRNYFGAKLPFPYIQSDMHESQCFPISRDHGDKFLSKLTWTEHIVAISLAWCMISVLFCCWGCCLVQFRDTCTTKGVVITCHHGSVIALKSFSVSLWILSLCLAANSWSPEPLLFYQLQIGLSWFWTQYGATLGFYFF